MSYVSGIFKRLDIQQIRAFLMNGVDTEVSKKSFTDRIKEAEQPICKIIEERFNHTDENRDIADQILQYAGTQAEIYMEIGMICGASIIAQLLSVPSDN